MKEEKTLIKWVKAANSFCVTKTHFEPIKRKWIQTQTWYRTLEEIPKEDDLGLDNLIKM